MKKNTENNDIKHRSTFAVLFYINRTKVRKDGTCQLLCKVSIDAEWEQIGTKVSVNPAIWNPGKGRADGRSANAVTVNRAIDDLTAEIEGHYRRIKDSLGFITAELVKNAVKGAGIHHGDLLLIRQQADVDNGDIAVVAVNGDEATLKRVKKQENALILQPENPACEPKIFVGKDMENIHIRGRLMQLRKEF